MILDTVFITLTLMLAVIGWRGGALRSLARWGAFVGASVLSVPLGTALQPQVAGWLPDYPQLARPASIFVAWIALLILLLIVASIVTRFAHLSTLLKRADRLLGLVLGLAKGLLLAYAVACFGVVLDEPLRKAWPPAGEQLDGSLAVAVARDVNLLDDIAELLPRRPEVDKPKLPKVDKDL